MGSVACIIDNDPSYVYSLQRILSKNELCTNVLLFNNGYEAIRTMTSLVKSDDIFPDIIFLDIDMPVMDGWDFLQEFSLLKAGVNKNTSIFIISSFLLEEDKVKAKAIADIAGCLSKPITADIVSNAIQTHYARTNARA